VDRSEVKDARTCLDINLLAKKGREQRDSCCQLAKYHSSTFEGGFERFSRKIGEFQTLDVVLTHGYREAFSLEEGCMRFYFSRFGTGHFLV